MVQVSVGRGKEGEKALECVLGALPWENSGPLPVCKNQRFDRSGAEMASVPAGLCGTALNLNPDNLKRLLWFQGPGSASLERGRRTFRCKFLHPAAGGSSKSSVTQLGWAACGPSLPSREPWLPLPCERNTAQPHSPIRAGLDLQLLRFDLQILRKSAVTASAWQAACTLMGPYWFQKGSLCSWNQRGLPCSSTMNNEAKCDPAHWLTRSLMKKSVFRISHPFPLLHWIPVIRYLDFGVKISDLLK